MEVIKTAKLSLFLYDNFEIEKFNTSVNDVYQHWKCRRELYSSLEYNCFKETVAKNLAPHGFPAYWTWHTFRIFRWLLVQPFQKNSIFQPLRQLSSLS